MAAIYSSIFQRICELPDNLDYPCVFRSCLDCCMFIGEAQLYSALPEQPYSCRHISVL